MNFPQIFFFAVQRQTFHLVVHHFHFGLEHICNDDMLIFGVRKGNWQRRGGKAKFTTRIMVEIPNNWGGDLWRQLRKCRWFQPQPMCHTKIPKILRPFSKYLNCRLNWKTYFCTTWNYLLNGVLKWRTPLNWVWCKNKSLCCSKGKSAVEPTKNNLQRSPKTLLCLPPQAPIISLCFETVLQPPFFLEPILFLSLHKNPLLFCEHTKEF